MNVGFFRRRQYRSDSIFPSKIKRCVDRLSRQRIADLGKPPAPQSWVHGLTYAHERAPERGENGADENPARVIAKRAAILAHMVAERADLMMIGGVKQARQHKQHCGHKIHQKSSVRE
jgi:hypothetical protein